MYDEYVKKNITPSYISWSVRNADTYSMYTWQNELDAIIRIPLHLLLSTTRKNYCSVHVFALIVGFSGYGKIFKFILFYKLNGRCIETYYPLGVKKVFE